MQVTALQNGNSFNTMFTQNSQVQTVSVNRTSTHITVEGFFSNANVTSTGTQACGVWVAVLSYCCTCVTVCSKAQRMMASVHNVRLLLIVLQEYTSQRSYNKRTLTCVLLHLCIDGAAMLPVLFVQLAIYKLDADCTMVLACNYVHILTVMSLTAECGLLFGWAADPRYIIELCFIFLRPPQTHTKDPFTCLCWLLMAEPILKHDERQQRIQHAKVRHC